MRHGKTRIVGTLSMCFGVFCLSSCTKISNGFSVKDAEGTISSAELRLCNNRLQLIKSGGEFRGEMLITCEGEGIILVHLSDGRETACKIGYVTPGAKQNFQFSLEHGSCHPTPQQ